MKTNILDWICCFLVAISALLGLGFGLCALNIGARWLWALLTSNLDEFEYLFMADLRDRNPPDFFHSFTGFVAFFWVVHLTVPLLASCHPHTTKAVCWLASG